MPYSITRTMPATSIKIKKKKWGCRIVLPATLRQRNMRSYRATDIICGFWPEVLPNNTTKEPCYFH